MLFSYDYIMILKFNFMLSIIWLISAILLLIAIMIHNPKSQGFGSQGQMFGNTRSAEQNLNKITWFLIFIFFILTVLLSINNEF